MRGVLSPLTPTRDFRDIESASEDIETGGRHT